MQLNLGQIREAVSDYLGLGLQPEGDDLSKVNNIIWRGYRTFLSAVNPRTGKNHVWSWLRKEAEIELEAGEWVYSLPTDFKRLYRKFIYSADNRYPPIANVTVGQVMEYRMWQEAASYPVICAIRAAEYTAGESQRKELILAPTPSQTYTINYTYVMNPPAPVEDSDYFIGDAQISEAILQSCLAVAEQQEDERIGTQTQLYQLAVNRMVQDDVPDAPDTAGTLTDGRISGRSLSKWRHLTRQWGDVSLDF